jgi:hypothetical protein
VIISMEVLPLFVLMDHIYNPSIFALAFLWNSYKYFNQKYVNLELIVEYNNRLCTNYSCCTELIMILILIQYLLINSTNNSRRHPSMVGFVKHE